LSLPAKRDQEKGRSVQPWLCCQHDAQHIQPQRRHVVKHISWQCKLLIVVCFLHSNCTNFFLFQSMQQWLATNQQAKAASQQATMSAAEALCQTTLT
jgi:hypothetical protein